MTQEQANEIMNTKHASINSFYNYMETDLKPIKVVHIEDPEPPKKITNKQWREQWSVQCIDDNRRYLLIKAVNDITGDEFIARRVIKYKGEPLTPSTGRFFQWALKKYYEHNFRYIILGEYNTWSELDEAYKHIVTQEYVNQANTYNIVPAGDYDYVDSRRLLVESKKPIEGDYKEWICSDQILVYEFYKHYNYTITPDKHRHDIDFFSDLTED